MTTITIDRALLVQAKNLLSRFMPDNFRDQDDQIEMLAKMDAALEAPATAPAQPSWQAAPTVPGLWLSSHSHEARQFSSFNIANGTYSYGRWFGPIPEDKP